MPNTKDLVVLEDPPRQVGQKKNLRVLALLVLSGLAGLVVSTLLPVKRATHSGAPAIHVGPVMVAEPWTETPLPIQLGPAEVVPKGGWIKIAGLPELTSLSEGHATEPGIWRVPISGLSTLKITAPAIEGMKSKISIALMSSDSTVLTEVRSVLAVMPAWLVGAGQTAPAARGPSGQAAQQTVAPTAPPPLARGEPAGALSKRENRRLAQKLVCKGDREMWNGQIAAARLAYEHAARMGWSPAAMALAASYDPNELVDHPTLGIVADPEAARSWYARARELANADMDSCLQQLGSPRL